MTRSAIVSNCVIYLQILITHSLYSVEWTDKLSNYSYSTFTALRAMQLMHRHAIYRRLNLNVLILSRYACPEPDK